MHTDHGVITGTHHATVAQACQDYAFSGAGNGFAWAAIADGCSSASGRSDIGARVMVLAAQEVLKIHGPQIMQESGSFEKALHAACEPWRVLLNPDDLRATLAVIAGDRHAVHGKIFGDGALMVKYTDGRLTVIEAVYPENAPEYPAYHFNQEHIRNWRETYSVPREIISRTVDGNSQLIEERCLSDDTWSFAPADEGIVCIAVASDGIASRNGITTMQTALEVMDFKGVKGTFMQRRLGSAARRTWRVKRTEPFDDLSVAAIWLGESDA